MPHSLLNGYEDSNWIGLNRAVINTGNIILNLEEQYSNATNQLWNNQAWTTLSLGTAPVTTTLNSYYTTYSNIQVANPNPQYSGTTIATDYTSNLGPPTTTYSYTGVITLQINQKISPLISIYDDLHDTTTLEVTNAPGNVNELKLALEKLTAFKNGTKLMEKNVHK
mmetsp:Transcript_22092/g.21797  ORF Transcript_22092/g.21797 Transcript_22092/m.21797 type:complete len:167 (-) Transcript_22092:1259-1759(-)